MNRPKRFRKLFHFWLLLKKGVKNLVTLSLTTIKCLPSVFAYHIAHSNIRCSVSVVVGTLLGG